MAKDAPVFKSECVDQAIKDDKCPAVGTSQVKGQNPRAEVRRLDYDEECAKQGTFAGDRADLLAIPAPTKPQRLLKDQQHARVYKRKSAINGSQSNPKKQKESKEGKDAVGKLSLSNGATATYMSSSVSNIASVPNTANVETFYATPMSIPATPPHFATTSFGVTSMRAAKIMQVEMLRPSVPASVSSASTSTVNPSIVSVTAPPVGERGIINTTFLAGVGIIQSGRDLVDFDELYSKPIQEAFERKEKALEGLYATLFAEKADLENRLAKREAELAKLRRDLEEATIKHEGTLAELNLAKFHNAQQKLKEAEERADLAEQAVAEFRVMGSWDPQHDEEAQRNNPINQLPDYLEMMVRKVAADRPGRVQENQEATDAEFEEDLFKAPEEEPSGEEKMQTESEPFTDDNNSHPEVPAITASQLDLFSQKIAPEWKKLAAKLGYKSDEIKFFEDENTSPAEQARNMLVLWFEDDVDATLANLVYILEGLSMLEAAEIIKNELKRCLRLNQNF